MLSENLHDTPIALSFDDVLLVPKHSKVKSRSEVDLTTKISPKLTLKIPLISTNMDTVTGVEMAINMSELGGMGVLPRFEPIQDQAEKAHEVSEAGGIVAVSVGIKEEDFDRAEALINTGATVIDVDVAHGHTQRTIDFTEKLREKYGDSITILAGIAATGECAEDLYNAGADCITVGVGGGSTCSTRIETGCGLPTLASLLDIRAVARKHNKTFMPLAGIKNPGDIVKSLAAGASAARAGNLFAGTDEAPGDIVEIEGKKYKKYSGSTSLAEKTKHVKKNGNNGKMYTKHIEGVEGLVAYKGPVKEVVARAIAGIRSGFSYCGAHNLEELWEHAEFVRVTNAGITESKSHDIIELDENGNG